MKYGQTFEAQSVPQWRAYNVDYNALKHLVKVNTSRDQGQAVTIPGHTDAALQIFEDRFFIELFNQHDRAELFVTSKYDEISRRLQHVKKRIALLLERCASSNGRPMSQKRRDRFTKYDDQIMQCGEDIRNLERFVDAQIMAFRKILKKYTKWTGSNSLGTRFNHEVLNDAKSFTKTDFEPLHSQYSDLLAVLRASTPDASQPATPSTRSRRASTQRQIQPAPQAYWNEYDNGSEAGEDEPYIIYVNSESSFPGSNMVKAIVSHALIPIEKVKSWLTPPHSPSERRLLTDSGGYFTAQQNLFDTDPEDDAYASSSDFPSGYATHYSTFPSVSDQKVARHREQLLFRSCLGSFSASFLLTLVAGVLVATGRRHLRVEVDAGVIIGVAASFFFAVVGLACMLGRTQHVGWLHRICVFATLTTLCILNGMLLVLVAGNTGL